MGPDMLGLCGWPDWLETELLGLASALVLVLNGVMLCDTPDANVNCSRSSTFVRPLAEISIKLALEKNQNQTKALDCFAYQAFKRLTFLPSQK